MTRNTTQLNVCRTFNFDSREHVSRGEISCVIAVSLRSHEGMTQQTSAAGGTGHHLQPGDPIAVIP